jgi:hypothetical protein
MPYTVTSCFWQVVDHWQTLIAGVFALLGGGVAYIGALQAARRQVKAVNAQTSAVERQNEALKRADRHRIARERLDVARLLDASLEVIASNIARVRAFYGGPPNGHIDEPLANSIRQGIGKPGFKSLRERIGVLDREIAVTFLTLEAEIDRLRAMTGATHVSGTTDRLDERAVIVSTLRSLVQREMDSANAVLSEPDSTG